MIVDRCSLSKKWRKRSNSSWVKIYRVAYWNNTTTLPQPNKEPNIWWSFGALRFYLFWDFILIKCILSLVRRLQDEKRKKLKDNKRRFFYYIGNIYLRNNSMTSFNPNKMGELWSINRNRFTFKFITDSKWLDLHAVRRESSFWSISSLPGNLLWPYNVQRFRFSDLLCNTSPLNSLTSTISCSNHTSIQKLDQIVHSIWTIRKERKQFLLGCSSC